MRRSPVLLIERIQPEAQPPSLRPLEVVHQRPDEHPADIDPFLDCSMDRLEMVEQKPRTLIVILVRQNAVSVT
jgi:hypothetical protein